MEWINQKIELQGLSLIIYKEIRILSQIISGILNNRNFWNIIIYIKSELDQIDIVIGTHPHMPQNIDIYKGKPIFYSLVNFIFNSFLDEPNAKIGWILEL